MKFSQKYYDNYTLHSHDSINISALDSGTIEIDFINNKSILGIKQIAITKKDQIHKSNKVDKNTKGYYSLYLNDTKLNQLNFNNIISHKGYYYDFIDLCKSLLEDKELDILLLKNFIEKITLLKIDSKTNNEFELVNKIKTLIKHDTTLTINDISKELNYSKEHIIRTFKSSTGITPHAYIINQKVLNAKQKIENNNGENMSLIAIESGFYDQSHFTKSFKKVFATTPNKIY